MQTDEIEKLLAEATPGPWFCNDDPRDGMEWNIHIHHTDEDRICFMSNMGESRVDEVEANARLIAMAPDLAADKIRLERENERLIGALMTIRQHYTSDQTAFAGQIARAALEGRKEPSPTG